MKPVLGVVLPPERPQEIHQHACANCPSKDEPDPAVEEFMAAPRDIQLESVFVCAWRPGKLCKGYCDRLDITDIDLKR